MIITKPKFIVDTNVIVSALLIKQSTSRQALDKAFGQMLILKACKSKDI
ncbi:MAG: hypothetical protein IMF12_01845 [Proteobacteria bacterium]|nr:hypothetical protein [Pseudomonadota bacterium]